MNMRHYPSLSISKKRNNIFLTIDIVCRIVWRNQRVNQNPYIEEEQTTQWAKSTKGQTTNYTTYA